MRNRKKTLLSGGHFRWLAAVALCAWVTCAVSTPARGQSGEEEELLDSLGRMWKQQKSEIVTAQYRIKLYRDVGKFASTPLTRKELHKFLKSLDVGQPGGFLEKLRVRLGVEERPGVSVPWGTVIDILEEQGKSRNNWHWNGQAKGRMPDVFVFNGTEEIHYVPFNRQASIFAGRSGISILTTYNLRYVPTGGSGKDRPPQKVLD